MDKEEPTNAAKVVAKPSNRSNSILKNKIGCSILEKTPIEDIPQEQKYGGR